MCKPSHYTELATATVIIYRKINILEFINLLVTLLHFALPLPCRTVLHCELGF
jgi:hypothetical protein